MVGGSRTESAQTCDAYPPRSAGYRHREPRPLTPATARLEGSTNKRTYHLNGLGAGLYRAGGVASVASDGTDALTSSERRLWITLKFVFET
jgi:hypothetical protein